MSTLRSPETLGWPEVIVENAADIASAQRLIGQLRACEVSALAFCRLLERWNRGDAHPATAGGRDAALRHAADRIETALTGLEQPLARYLLELEPSFAEGGTWYSQPSIAELLDWEPVLRRAGVHACPNRVAQTYLELAVLVRALESLSDAVRMRLVPDRSSLWAGLFDLRENLLGRTLDDLRALADVGNPVRRGSRRRSVSRVVARLAFLLAVLAFAVAGWEAATGNDEGSEGSSKQKPTIAGLGGQRPRVGDGRGLRQDGGRARRRLLRADGARGGSRARTCFSSSRARAEASTTSRSRTGASTRTWRPARRPRSW